MKFSALLPIVGSFLQVASAIDSLSIAGSKFFNSDGSQFFIKGVAYQRSPEDPLLDGSQCKMDADLMHTLGANTIRVYHVDANGDHDDCVNAFADKGIYLFVDLDTFSTQIEQDGPPHWNQSQLTAFTDVVDAFQGYNNVAGFFVGNEIITTSNGSLAAPYIKAATRDVKNWIAGKAYSRPIYIGYSAADISELRPNLQNYLICDADTSTHIDFFGLNAYEWCGASNYHQSGYDALTANLTEYPVPVFFSEDGCNTVAGGRDFADQASIFGPNMNGIWSGAIIYEWIQEANKYGLISYGDLVNTATAVGGNPTPTAGTPTPLADFNALSTAWATLSPTGTSSKDYTPTANSTPSCPALTAGIWNVDPSSSLPTLGQTANAAAATGGESASNVPTSTGASPSSTHKGSADGLKVGRLELMGVVGVVLGAALL